ncbi:hypothetical protein Scep_007584 [Stephania cephalantha]|uniref:Uncharacterized protein n=1 Tax=Stephania cephalantha TaxID=152367 RepID=A0AAP0KAC7_9MAGN
MCWSNNRINGVSSSGGPGGGTAVAKTNSNGTEDAGEEGRCLSSGDNGSGAVNDVEQRCGGALPDRSIPDETQQKWTRRRDFEETRRRDGLLAKKTKGVDFGVETSIEGHCEFLNHIDFNYNAN